LTSEIHVLGPIKHPAYGAMLTACALALLTLACASGPRALNRANTDQITVIIRNDAQTDLNAYVVLLDHLDAIKLGPVKGYQTLTLRIDRGRLAGNWLELRAYARSEHSLNMQVVASASRGTFPDEPQAGVQYAHGPFTLGAAREIEWKLDYVNYQSSLRMR
jgi:hypothetical protein